MLLAFTLMPYARATPGQDESLAGVSDAQRMSTFVQAPANNDDIMLSVRGTALTTALANTEIKRATVTVIGEGLEGVTTAYRDKGFMPRSGVVLANLGFVASAHDMSHEYGHYRAAWNEGARDITIKIDSFNRSYFEYENLENDSPDARFRIMAAGLNQNSLNGLDAYRHSQLETTKHYHDLDKIYSRMYLHFYLGKRAGNANDDHTQMFEIMNENGYDVTHSEFKQNSTLITFLSPDNWQSMLNIGKFLYTGRSANRSPYLQVKSLGIGLPSLSHFFTEDGDFVAYRQFFAYGKDRFELSADHDLDATHTSAGLNRFRIGFTHHKRYPDTNLTVSPYAHVTLERSSSQARGINLGIEATGPISNRLFLSGLAEVNRDDLMARANGRGNGIWAFMGLSYLF